MKSGKRIMTVLFMSLFVCSVAVNSANVSAKSVIENRLAEVKKDFPNGSKFNSYVSVNGFSGGGCNALVMYTTLKVFHNAYTPNESTFRAVGKSTSAKSISKMKKLFNKAKVGDVIRWRADYTDAHFAIYLSSNSSGIYIYEANFGPKNKVWYKHFWPWSAMSKWPAGGANKVNVYRSKNYGRVNQKKSAVNYRKGQTFVVSGIHYKVTKVKGISGEVKVIGYDEGREKAKIPKQIFVNMPNETGLNTNEDSYAVFSKSKNISEQVTYRVVK